MKVTIFQHEKMTHLIFIKKITMKIWDFLKKYPYVPVALVFVALALVIRLTNLNYASGDYNSFLRHWMNDIVELGGFASLGTSIGDYSPPYVLILTILSYFPTPESTTPFLHPIKHVSIIFDVVMAIGVFFVVLQTLKNHKNKYPLAIFAGTFSLYLPTVFLNSTIWGQSDSIYTAFIVWSLYLFLKNKHFWGMVVYGIAFSFKLQAIFVLPLLIMIYVLNRPKQLWHFLLIPLVYIIFSIPALAYGRDFIDVMTIYLRQTDTYQHMTLNMPNMYTWFPNRYDLLRDYAIALFALIMAVSFFYLVIKKIRIRQSHIIDVAIWVVLMCNFFLPAMHERYLFPADVLSIAYFAIRRKNIYIPILVNFISLIAYLPFLFGLREIPFEYVAIVYMILIIFYTRQLFNELEKTEIEFNPLA
jgi:Gpi18-like mannosyltransferase